jgi:hypothetical protein
MFELAGRGLDTEQVFAHDEGMMRTRVRGRALLIISGILIGAVLGGPLAGAIDASDPVAKTKQIVVRPGDSMWSIAGRVAPARDPREVVYAIREMNEAEPDELIPGQVLIVPAAP